MPDEDAYRMTAEAIGRIACIKTGVEIGLLYQWDDGTTQAALYEDKLQKSAASKRPHDTAQKIV